MHVFQIKNIKIYHAICQFSRLNIFNDLQRNGNWHQNGTYPWINVIHVYGNKNQIHVYLYNRIASVISSALQIYVILTHMIISLKCIYSTVEYNMNSRQYQDQYQ